MYVSFHCPSTVCRSVIVNCCSNFNIVTGNVNEFTNECRDSGIVRGFFGCLKTPCKILLLINNPFQYSIVHDRSRQNS